MTRVLIELDEEQGRYLRDLANAERRPAEELCREAVECYLKARITESRSSGESERYAPFLKMIGLVQGGPTDASICHDRRPEDPV